MEYAIVQELSRGVNLVLPLVDRDAQTVRIELAPGDLPIGFSLETRAPVEAGFAYRLVSTARRDQGGGTMALTRAASRGVARKVFARPPRNLRARAPEGVAAWTCPGALDLPARAR